MSKITIWPDEHLLSTPCQQQTLQAQNIEVLLYLIHAYPRLVTREELIEHIWKDNYYVGEKALTHSIWQIRKTIKELDPEQEYIETVRKSGYKLAIKPVAIKTASRSLPPAWALVAFTFAVLLISWQLMSLIKEPEQNTIKTITDHPGRELFPVPSPNEKYLAYYWRKDIYLLDLEKTEAMPVNFSNSQGKALRSAWSSDSSKLFFTDKYKSECLIKVKSLDETEPNSAKTIAKCRDGKNANLSTSSDGKWLAYISEKDELGFHSLTLSDLKTGSQIKLPCSLSCVTRDYESVEFSPNSRTVAFSSNDLNGQERLYLYDIKSRTERLLLSGFDDLRGFTWHPSGKKIFFSASEHGKRNNYWIDIKSGQVTQSNLTNLSYPHYAKSATLYFHDWKVNTFIAKQELAQPIFSSPEPLLSTNENSHSPSYCPNQNAFIYISNKSGSDQLWWSNFEGTGRKKLTTFSGEVASPVCAPSGSKAAFIVNTDAGNVLYQYDFKNNDLTLIDTGFHNHNKPSWSKDSTTLYIGTQNNIFQIQTTDNNKVTKVTQGDYVQAMSKHTFIVQDESGLFWFDTKGSGKQKQLLRSDTLLPSSSWQLTEHGIYFFNLSKGDYRVSFYDFKSEQIQDVTKLPERAYSRTLSMAYVPSKAWLLFTGYHLPNVDIKAL